MVLLKYCKYCKTFFEIEHPNQRYTCGKKSCRHKRDHETIKLKSKSDDKYREHLNENARKWRNKDIEHAREIARRSMKKRTLLGKSKEYQKRYIKEHKEEWNKTIQKWRKTENGRKYNDASHRKKGHIEILPNIFEDCKIDRHHIEYGYPFVVPIPRKIHLSTNGRWDEHYIKNKQFIEKTYMINTDIFLGSKEEGDPSD